jgi:hypothetical protein
MTAVSRSRVACSLLLFAALWLSAVGGCWAQQSQASFVEAPKEVKGYKVVLKIQVPQAELEGVDVWVGVVPVAANSTIWLQGSGVDTSEHDEIVYLGRDIREDMGKYQVRIVSFPKGSIKEEGAVKMSEAKKKGMKTLVSIVIDRTE